jgi:hypothetical protein
MSQAFPNNSNPNNSNALNETYIIFRQMSYIFALRLVRVDKVKILFIIFFFHKNDAY